MVQVLERTTENDVTESVKCIENPGMLQPWLAGCMWNAVRNLNVSPPSLQGDADYVVGGRARGGRGRYARAAATAAGRGRLQRRRRGEDDDLAATLDEGRGKRRRRGD